MVGCGLAAEACQSFGCDPLSCDLFGDPVADLGRTVLKVIDIETTDDRAIAVDEHEEDTDTGVLCIASHTLELEHAPTVSRWRRATPFRLSLCRQWGTVVHAAASWPRPGASPARSR